MVGPTNIFMKNPASVTMTARRSDQDRNKKSPILAVQNDMKYKVNKAKSNKLYLVKDSSLYTASAFERIAGISDGNKISKLPANKPKANEATMR